MVLVLQDNRGINIFKNLLHEVFFEFILIGDEDDKDRRITKND